MGSAQRQWQIYKPQKKKDRGLQFCVDYRRLNDVTTKDSYPLPRINNALDSVSGSIWFSTMDFRSGYWQTSFLGHVISKEVVSTDPVKVKAVEQWPVPTSTAEMRSRV
ncbi:hypothetical protein AAFF_G00089050 [Aldrovandia affinis]|uniref:Uncharacterized protein n=1 Tax=Aldrovandia affinis TaxID=143900 RepID=A0AAD7RYM4_9TELE|nr:hypothetical protein AAFF_G00089050 [Aldrovandia affinis]